MKSQFFLIESAVSNDLPMIFQWFSNAFQWCSNSVPWFTMFFQWFWHSFQWFSNGFPYLYPAHPFLICQHRLSDASQRVSGHLLHLWTSVRVGAWAGPQKMELSPWKTRDLSTKNRTIWHDLSHEKAEKPWSFKHETIWKMLKNWSGILIFQSAIFICKTNMNQENWGIEPTIADMLIS